MWVSILVGLALLVLSGCQALCQAEMILFCQFVLIVKPKNGSERGPGNIGKHQANIFPQVPGLWSWRDGPGERKPKACYEVDGGEMKAVRDWSALAFWNVTALLLCFGIPALPWTALLLYCHQQPVPQWEMTLLDQRSPGPAENWDMMEKKESILTYSLLALGSKMDFFFHCLGNRLPLSFGFIVCIFSFPGHISTPWIIYMFQVLWIIPRSRAKQPKISTCPFTADNGIVFISPFTCVSSLLFPLL